MLKHQLKKYALITLGSLTMGLGVVGVIIPVLPTTPFLLVTAFCFLRSSERLYHWLFNHRLFGRYLQDYLERRTVSRKIKVGALGMLWPSLLICMSLVPLPSVRILVALIGMGVSIYIIRLKESVVTQG